MSFNTKASLYFCTNQVRCLYSLILTKQGLLYQNYYIFNSNWYAKFITSTYMKIGFMK
jgi:hypothetical protein